MHCMYVLLISKCADCVFWSKFGFMILVKFTFYKICNFTFNLQHDESTAIVKRYRNASFNLDNNHRILSHTERFTLYWTEWITHTHTHTHAHTHTHTHSHESRRASERERVSAAVHQSPVCVVTTDTHQPQETQRRERWRHSSPQHYSH